MAGRREEAEGGAGQVASLVMMRRQAGPGGRGGRGRAGPGGGPVTKSDTPGPRLRYDSGQSVNINLSSDNLRKTSLHLILVVL